MNKHFFLTILFTLLTLPALAQTTTMDIGYCSDVSADAMGYGETVDNIAALEFDAELLNPYAGNEIKSILVQLGASFGSAGSVFATYSLTDPYAEEGYMFETEIPNFDYVPCYKWVEIPLAKSILIEKDKPLYAGIRIAPYTGKTFGTYQFAIDDDPVGHKHSYIYNVSARKWDPMSKYEVEGCAAPALMIRLRIEGNTLPTNDISVSNLQSVEYLRTSESLQCTYMVSNMATNDVNSFDAELLIDGEKAASKSVTLSEPLKPGDTKEFGFDDIRFGNEGTHTITVRVSNPNGVEDIHPEDNAQEKKVSVIDRYFKHRVLVEAFTTMSCANCPGAHDRENEAFKDINDVVRVAHHSGFYTDALTTSHDQAYLWFYDNGGTTYAPGIMFDRAMVDYFFDTQRSPGEENSPVFGPGDPENIIYIHNYLAAEPAYVDVNLNAHYDASTRKLDITVSGEVIAHLAGKNPTINVWLTESKLSAAENPNYAQTMSDGSRNRSYVHDHAMRTSLTGNWGQAISLPIGTYSQSFSTTLNTSWKAENMEIVAFVGNYDSSNTANCRIYNCAALSLSDLMADGVEQISMNPSTADNEVYDLQGRRMNTVSRGCYIKGGRPVLIK